MPPTLEELENEVREIGRTIVGGLPPGMGFFLTFFDLGASGFMTYMSNGQRRDMIRLLRELADRMEAERAGPAA